MRTPPCWHPDLRLPTPRNVRNKCLLCISHLVNIIFIIVARTA